MGEVVAMDRLAALRARVAAAKAEAARDLLSDGDREEIALRDEEEKHRAALRAKEREARALDLARRLDEARAKYPKAVLEPLDLEDQCKGAGTYIVRNPPPASVAAWQSDVATIRDAKQRDRVQRTFAQECILEWNGRDLDTDKGAGAELHNLWTQEFGFVATTIANLGAQLGGLAETARKS